MRRTCPARMRSTPTPSPSTKAVSPPPRRKRERRRRSIISTRPCPARRRSAPSSQEIARALRGRAANPRWLAGQMRHGHRGAAEIAQSLDNLYCFAALTDAVDSAQFDLMFDATLGDDSVRAFLVDANRQAASSHGGRVRGGGEARVLALAPQFKRAHSGFGAAGGRMSAVAARRSRSAPLLERLVSGRSQADGDRRRTACARARAERAAVARSGRGARGRRDWLRQWRDRPFSARQSAPAGLERADAARPACAP